MIDQFISLLRGGALHIRSHPQLIMTLVLVVVIPIAFIVSGQEFLSAARENQERLEKDRIGIMHDVFGSFMVATNFDASRIQREIEHLKELNPDITKFRIAKEEGMEVYIIAALDPESIGTFATNPDTYRIGNMTPHASMITPHAYDGVRYWQSFRLIRTEQNEDYYIFTETSLANIDAVFAARIMYAYYWLIGLILVVLILIIRHVRLIDYAYLYSETKKANETKDLFTNMVAHELRAPLTAIRGYASMIRENESLGNDIRGQGKQIEDAAERLIVVVSDLLDVARIQSGKMSIDVKDTDVTSLIAEVVSAQAATAEKKHIGVHAEGCKSPLMIATDGKRLYQVLTNLMSNALKYTRSGDITISLTDLKDRIEIRVKDTGMGISSEDQQKLFAPFFRVENSEVASITGTGLGMWVTKQLVELMGGSIGVESIKGVGTHVVVTLRKKS